MRARLPSPAPCTEIHETALSTVAHSVVNMLKCMAQSPGAVRTGGVGELSDILVADLGCPLLKGRVHEPT
eukprot:18304-Eustigmatos_ZCMA.PRE.1